MNIENELEGALSREAPPRTLREAVMKKVGEGERNRRRTTLTRIAATFLVGGMLAFAAVQVLNERAERREGEAAKQELLLALRITAEKTAVVRHAVQHEQ